MLNAISSGMMLSQINYTGTRSSNVSERMFGAISVRMGGDGKTISKENWSAYTKKAEEGSVSTSDKQMKILKTVDNNWDNMFEDQKELTLKEFQRNLGIFLPLIVDSSTDGLEYTTEKIKFYKDKAKPVDDVIDDVKEKQKASEEKKQQIEEQDKTSSEKGAKSEEYTDLAKKVNATDEGITKQDLRNYLKDLLKENNQADTSDDVAYVTNLIEDFDNITGGKEHMTSLKKETVYEA